MSMSKIIGGMGVTLWADSRPFKKGVDEARTSIRKFGQEQTLAQKRMKDWQESQDRARRSNMLLGAGLATFAVGAAYKAAQAVEQLGNNYEALASSMNKALSVYGKLSEAQRKQMFDAAAGVSKSTLFNTDQSLQALRFIGSAGYSPEDAKALLPSFAEFAQAGQFDLATAVNYAADAQAALGMKSQDASQNLKNLTRVTDVLTKANILSNAEVEDFAAALTNGLAGALRQVNKDMEEGVAVLAAFAEQGIKGEKAGEAASIVMRDLQTKALANKEAFKAAGISVFDAAGNMRDMADIVEDLEKRLYGLSDAGKKEAILNLGITDRSVGRIQSLLGMSDKLREYKKEFYEAGGVTKEVSDSIMTPYEKALHRQAAAYDRISTSLGGYKTAIAEAKAATMEWMAESDPMEGATWGERFSAAAPWNWKAPELPDYDRIQRDRAAAMENARRQSSANAFWQNVDTWKSGFGASSQPGMLGSGISRGLGWLQSGGQVANNLLARVREEADSSVQKDFSRYAAFGKSLGKLP